MNSQHLLNLEYLQRATDPSRAEPERREMLESLAYAMSEDKNARDWVYATFTSVEVEALSDSMLHWVADWAETLPRDQVSSEIRDLPAKLWRPLATPTIQARLFECAATLDETSEQAVNQDFKGAAAQIIIDAVGYDAQNNNLQCSLPLVDMILSRANVHLLKMIAGQMRERQLNLQPSLQRHVALRLPALPYEFRQLVVREFQMDEEF